MDVDVLVIGAGPAGSACACRAAERGLSVALVDRVTFPRDKACGDALIPDALAALRTLGVELDVGACARALPALRVYAPGGRHVELHGRSACVPRRELDDLLRRAAERRGATFLAPLALREAIVEDGRVAGARFRSLDGEADVAIRAGTTVLATGAAAQPLQRFGVCRRVGPSATAARFYVRVDPGAAADFDHLCISYDASICPGYGWIFPGPDGVFNLGVGFFYDARRLPRPAHLRVLLERFLSTFPPAVSLLRHAQPVSDVRGAPLRTAMTGSGLSRPGLLVAGEAAGLTYSFSGEGIGKALESGMIAADVAAQGAGSPVRSAADMARAYADRLTERFADRFDAYRTAQRWLTSPTVANLLAWRARSSRPVRGQLEAMFNETTTPRELFSAHGLTKALLSRAD